MSFTSVSERDSFLFKTPNTGAHLGPGTYDFEPKGEHTALLKKRLQSRNAAPFNSHQPRSASYIPGGFTPGPGLYTNKQKSSFAAEFIKSEDDPSEYYLI